MNQKTELRHAPVRLANSSFNLFQAQASISIRTQNTRCTGSRAIMCILMMTSMSWLSLHVHMYVAHMHTLDHYTTSNIRCTALLMHVASIYHIYVTILGTIIITMLELDSPMSLSAPLSERRMILIKPKVCTVKISLYVYNCPNFCPECCIPKT
ncbi:hypothetical protein 14 [Diadegma semiclausum ichnovirus]|nr:hypothetical protein 14 [Diadegma semiclausum ichnovirus]